MVQSIKLCLGVVILAAYLAELTVALECLFCKSSDLDSECRLGQRKYKPKLNNCNGPNAKCYALAEISNTGISKFKRGCTIYPDFCDNQTDVEYCQTCGSKFCNFWIMDLASDAETFLRDEQEAVLAATTKRALFNTERLRKRRIFDDAEKAADVDSSLSVGVKDLLA